MNGFLVRKDSRTAAGDPISAYLERKPCDGSWFWTYGQEFATVVTPEVGQAIAASLRQEREDGVISVTPDWRRREPEVREIPAQFKVAA